MPSPKSAIDQLEQKLGVSWSNIAKARRATDTSRSILQKAFAGRVAADTSVVIFGSIARKEVTSGSDADWILLVDGQAFPEHENQTHDVAEILERRKFAKPGRSGIFGGMVGSHSLVHEIGGEDDTNSNTTRRVLLLLESFAVGDLAAYKRVRRQILNRYVQDDHGLLFGKGPLKVPRFLLNDFTRYWRTITVDFVYKQRADSGKKWALRNAKLRMSRKLVFVSGLLRCFFCHLDPVAKATHRELVKQHDPTGLLNYLEVELATTPLELLARAALRPGCRRTTAKTLFDSYDAFLGILDNQRQRNELSNLRTDQLESSIVWKNVRHLSHPFQAGLTDLFYGPDEDLKRLMIDYGVF